MRVSTDTVSVPGTYEVTKVGCKRNKGRGSDLRFSDERSAPRGPPSTASVPNFLALPPAEFAQRKRGMLHRGMPDFAAPVERLIDQLKHLPGIGQKTAQRLAFHLLRAAPQDALALADAIRDAKEKIRECAICGNITDTDPCLYCAGPTRNRRTICVVEEAHNILAIEKTRTYSGMYHVLGGSLAPLQGRGPEQLKIKQLIERLKGAAVEEIIIATNPTAEGEATAVYLSKLLKPLGVRVTRIGVGIPVGADLEYADEITMLKAMEGRRDL